MTENKKYNAIAFRCWVEEKGYKKSTTGWFETIYADAPGPYTSRKISHVAKTDSELYDLFATSSQDPDDSASYERWLDKPGLDVSDIHVGDMSKSADNQPSVEADQHILSEDNAKQYVSDEDKKNAAADKFRQSQEKFPSPEADQQVPRQSIADVCGNIPVAEAFKIAKWADVEMESLQHQVSTLKESFKSSVYQHDQDMEIVKGERDELCDLLNILNEGYSDHFTKFLNDRIYKALNRFTNKH